MSGLVGLDGQDYLEKLQELIRDYSITNSTNTLSPYNQAIISILREGYDFAEQCFRSSVPIDT
ncbi:hypothetical protein H7T88_07435 [Paenibacillus cucumis Kampfer et al. 2016]|uniref:Uncharacterized protein n=1 Tax=Paenibacillus cucumis (ex Kampfer et al. 2016) TaxID=1776858 RepID=A0ABS7KFY5_9BACL|nr:hypothetical protein [Paenibacillus cucumis (ex Kampfer et al. 2016)]